MKIRFQSLAKPDLWPNTTLTAFSFAIRYINSICTLIMNLKKTNYVKNGNISSSGFMTPFIPSKRWSKWFFLVSFFWGTFSLSHWHFRLLSQTSNIIIRYLFFVCRVDCDGQRIIGQWKKGVNSLVTNHYDQRNRFRIKR